MNALKNLPERQAEIASKRLVVGFDGFIDTIARPVRQAASQDKPAEVFEAIREFGEYLTGCAEKSCSIELKVEAKQLGGNLPLFSRGAGKLGLDVTCIGMLGEDGAIDRTFQEMPCRLYSFAPAGQSTNLEFRDGKVFLAPDNTLPGSPWELVLGATGGTAAEIFRNADLTALLNWSELAFAQELWESAYEEAFAGEPCDKSRFAFFDLCDCSRKTKAEIEAVLSLIGRFTKQRTAILSVNENEAHVISSRVLDGSREPASIAKLLQERYSIDEVLIHTIRESFLATCRGTTLHPTLFVEQPKLSTGAGDHFNAAFCFGTAMGFSDEDRILFANRYANFYISQGYSPSLQEMVHHTVSKPYGLE